eukprot:6139838-Prymnesium_polylepis.2
MRRATASEANVLRRASCCCVCSGSWPGSRTGFQSVPRLGCMGVSRACGGGRCDDVGARRHAALQALIPPGAWPRGFLLYSCSSKLAVQQEF